MYYVETEVQFTAVPTPFGTEVSLTLCLTSTPREPTIKGAIRNDIIEAYLASLKNKNPSPLDSFNGKFFFFRKILGSRYKAKRDPTFASLSLSLIIVICRK